MIGRETRVLLRHYLDQGVSKAAIARQLGISRRTVYRWIASGQLDRELDDGAVQYGPRARRVSKLDPYKGVIDARLAEWPELSAVRLFDEVRAAGYAGGYDQVKRYVREVRPGVPEEPVQRFETPPGHQAQVDFAEFRLPWDLNWAAKSRDEQGRLLLDSNPLRGLGGPKVKNPTRVVLSDEEYEALLMVSRQVGWQRPALAQAEVRQRPHRPAAQGALRSRRLEGSPDGPPVLSAHR